MTEHAFSAPPRSPSSPPAQQGAWLFPELNGESRRFAVKWSRLMREKCGIKDGRKVFHSFRHTWKDAARAVMPEEHHDAITGHTNGSVGRGYGRGVPLHVLAESMAKISFKGIPS